MPIYKLQDFLIKHLESQAIPNYQLLKSQSIVAIDVSGDFLDNLFSFNISGITGLKLDDTGRSRVIFDNSLDETTI
jgi:hypothetical protein